MNALELLHGASGLTLSAASVGRAVRERMQKRGVADSDDYLRAIDDTELAALIDLVVVPESWMFRDPGAFAAATAWVRARVAADAVRVTRILSVPCAGGEEPYSMAIALTDAGVPFDRVGIEGIDLSAAAIERARQGLFTRNAFRSSDLAFRDRHFTREGDDYRIAAPLREKVRFRQANLLTLDTGLDGARYDIIFCRNLLIYFDEETAGAAIAVLHSLLADDGILFAGHAEVPAFCRHGFAPLEARGAFALRKEGRTPPSAPAPRKKMRPTPRPQPQRWTAPPPPPPASITPEPDLLALAHRQAGEGDLAGAERSCAAALARDPQAADAYFILGLISDCEQRGDAGDLWRRCVYLDPGHYDALCHLALLAEAAGDLAAARAYRQRASRVYARRAKEDKA